MSCNSSMEQGQPNNKPPESKPLNGVPPSGSPKAPNTANAPNATPNAANAPNGNNSAPNAANAPNGNNNVKGNNAASNAPNAPNNANAPNAAPNAANAPNGNNNVKGNNAASNAPKSNNAAPNAANAPNATKGNNAAAKAKNVANPDEGKRPFFAYTQAGFWGGPNADYTTLAILACFPLTGIIGLDHVYLRSPLTATIKAILNVFSLGLWYFFDAAQVLTEGDKIRSIGYSMPVFGPTGLGAGIFTKDEQTPSGPSPLRFLLYALAALIPLPFGQDFFAAGDMWGGLAKLATLFMPLLWIFGFAWGIYVIFRLFFQTEALITEGVPRFFPWSIIMSDFYCSRGILGPDRECSLPEAASKGGLLWSIGQMLRGLPIIGRAIDPIMSAAETTAAVTQAVVEKAVKPSIQFATASVGAAKEVLSTVPQVASNVANQAKAFTDPAALQKLALNQRGGGHSTKSMTPLIVLLIAGLASSGYLLAKVRNMVDFDLSKLSKVIKAPRVRGPSDTPPGRPL